MVNIVEPLYAFVFLVVGLSHLLQYRLWADFFTELLKNRFAPFIIALYTAPVGLLIVATHNTWVYDIPVVITAMGWGMCIKSAVYLVFPKSIRSLARDVHRTPRKFALVGVVMTGLGVVLLFHVMRGHSN